jgi:hypothetical protein
MDYRDYDPDLDKHPDEHSIAGCAAGCVLYLLSAITTIIIIAMTTEAMVRWVVK